MPVDAQAQQALVIQGGTLVDGNGGPPVANSFVVIQGNQITAVGPAGQVQVPAGAQAINANGKWVLPGLWDAQANYSWFWGELFLHHGITSLVDIGLGSELSIADRDSINKGLGRGPRQWIGVAHFGGFDEAEVTGYETSYDGVSVPYRRVSPTELQVTLDSHLLNKPGRYPIVVKNPEPMEVPVWGNGTSNVANLIVQYR